MEIKTVDRIKQYLDVNSISLNAFDKAIGAGNGYFGKQLKRQASVGSDVLEKIICIYSDLNPTWLLTGEGDMLRNLDSINKIVDYTPVSRQDKTPFSDIENVNKLHATGLNKLHPTLHPTPNLGLPKVVMITEDNSEVIALVPVKASAGYLNGYSDPEYMESLPTIRMPNLGHGTHRAFEIKGHSMSPTMHNSSISIGRWIESFEDIRDGRIYIIVTKSEGIVSKRVLNRVNDAGKLILLSDNQNKKDYPNILLPAEDVLELWYQRANLAFEFPEPDIIYNRVNDLEARMSLFEDKVKNLLK